jgi:hypothetical protein
MATIAIMDYGTCTVTIRKTTPREDKRDIYNKDVDSDCHYMVAKTIKLVIKTKKVEVKL